MHITYANSAVSLDPIATKLIFMPVVELGQREGTYEIGAYYRSEDSTAPMEVFELDEVVIEIEK